MSFPGSSVVRGRFIQGLVRGVARVSGSKRRIATATAGVLAAAMGYHVIFGHNGLIAYKQKRDETKTLDVQIEALRRENEQLQDHTLRLQNDPDAIEHQAREELHYTRPGEVIYTLPVK